MEDDVLSDRRDRTHLNLINQLPSLIQSNKFDNVLCDKLEKAAAFLWNLVGVSIEESHRNKFISLIDPIKISIEKYFQQNHRNTSKDTTTKFIERFIYLLMIMTAVSEVVDKLESNRGESVVLEIVEIIEQSPIFADIMIACIQYGMSDSKIVHKRFLIQLCKWINRRENEIKIKNKTYFMAQQQQNRIAMKSKKKNKHNKSIINDDIDLTAEEPHFRSGLNISILMPVVIDAMCYHKNDSEVLYNLCSVCHQLGMISHNDPTIIDPRDMCQCPVQCILGIFEIVDTLVVDGKHPEILNAILSLLYELIKIKHNLDELRTSILLSKTRNKKTTPTGLIYMRLLDYAVQNPDFDHIFKGLLFIIDDEFYPSEHLGNVVTLLSHLPNTMNVLFESLKSIGKYGTNVLSLIKIVRIMIEAYEQKQ